MTETAQPSASQLASQLFMVRIWLDGNGHIQAEWRGKVQHVPTGAWRYFRSWDGLVAFLETQLEVQDPT